MIEPELVFRSLKAVLDRPPMAFDRHQQIAPRGELKGDATSNPFGQWLSPVGLFGGKLKDGLGAGRIGLRQVLEGIATTS